MAAVAAAKRHTVALTTEGDLWTWGHCKVSPRRVQLVGARDVAREDGSEVLFHKGQTLVARPVAAAIAAGAAHSSCLTQVTVVPAAGPCTRVLQLAVCRFSWHRVDMLSSTLRGHALVNIARPCSCRRTPNCSR